MYDMHLPTTLCTMQIRLMQQWVSIDIQQLQQKRHLPSNEESCLYNIQLFQQNCRILSLQAWKTHCRIYLQRKLAPKWRVPFLFMSVHRNEDCQTSNQCKLKKEVCSPALATLWGTGPTYAPLCSQQCYLSITLPKWHVNAQGYNISTLRLKHLVSKNK